MVQAAALEPIHEGPAQSGGSRLRRRLVLVGGGCLALIVAVTVATALDLLPGGSQGEGTVTLRKPIRFVQVEGVSASPCVPGTFADPDTGQCIKLTSKVLTVNEVVHIRHEWQKDTGGPVVSLKLMPADAAGFAQLTTEAGKVPEDEPGRRIAILVDDQVLSAPSVDAPIVNGELQISGDFTSTETEDLVRRITGRS